MIVSIPDLCTLTYFVVRDFMLSLSDNNQTDIIEAFYATSRYLDDILNIDNPYFEQMVVSKGAKIRNRYILGQI